MKYHPKPVILIFSFGLLSHYLRCLVLARHLSPFCKIKFAGHAHYSSFVEQEGFSIFNCESMDEEDAINRVKGFDFSWLNEENLESSFLSQVKAIEEHKPIAVLGDAVPTLKMAAEYTGIPYLSLLNGYMSKFYADKRSLSKTHPAYPLVAKLPEQLKEVLTELGEAMAFRKIHKPFKNLRIKYKLKPQSSYLNEMEGDHNLICDLPYLFPLKDNGPFNYTCIGPLIYNGSYSQKTSKIDGLDPAKQTIFVSMGSTGSWENITFLNNIHYTKFNIVTAGDSKAVLNAAHIIKKDFVAAEQLLPYTDLVLCHGGNGTLYQALSYGIPILCAPAHFEQEWNVAALEKKELAKSLEYGKEDTEYEQIIDEWIVKKGSGVYREISKKIKSSTGSLHSQAESIILALKRHQAKAEATITSEV